MFPTLLIAQNGNIYENSVAAIYENKLGTNWELLDRAGLALFDILQRVQSPAAARPRYPELVGRSAAGSRASLLGRSAQWLVRSFWLQGRLVPSV